jgi:hypothetical protein
MLSAEVAASMHSDAEHLPLDAVTKSLTPPGSA